MTDRLQKQLDFLVEVDKMKQVLRATLVMDKSRYENDAEHSWHFALMTMLLYEYAGHRDDVNLFRVLKMALVHDLIEVYAGDTPAYDVAGNETKADREKEAADRLFALLPEDQGAEVRALWEEFDAMETPDSRYASAIDRLQPFIANAMTDGHSWQTMQVTKAQVYQRMDMVRHGAPELWSYVEGVVDDHIKKGNLLP